jgi:mono/diheme cytochrome c family protein
MPLKLRSKCIPAMATTEKVAVVGLPDTAVRESKDRVLPAITHHLSHSFSGKCIACHGPSYGRMKGGFREELETKTE